jgi:hypothetical protein
MYRNVIRGMLTQLIISLATSVPVDIRVAYMTKSRDS